MTLAKNYHRKVRVRIPASTSNLGPGFDILGMALGLYNEMEVELWVSSHSKPRRLEVEIEGEGALTLPRGGHNMAVRAAQAALPDDSMPLCMRFHMKNRIPTARGLGSSAAARLGGVLAAYTLYHHPPHKDLKKLLEERALPIALRLEGHPDNLLPAFHGGLCAALQNGEALRHFPISPPRELVAVLCIPEFELSTDKARGVLPEKISRQDAILTVGRVALLVGAIEQKRFDWLRLAMQDVLHQPYRRHLVPGMQQVIDAAVQAGAFGAALSGAGPSIFAFAPRGPRAPVIGRAMQKAFLKYRVESSYHVLEIDRKGAVVDILE